MGIVQYRGLEGVVCRVSDGDGGLNVEAQNVSLSWFALRGPTGN
jgi:hypothetical protein